MGPHLLSHFGFIHCFSFLVLICIPLAIRGIRRGNVRAHRGNMIGVYVGGILISASFTLMWGGCCTGGCLVRALSSGSARGTPLAGQSPLR